MCCVLRLRLWLLLIAFLVLGCVKQKPLDKETTLSIEPGDIKAFIIDAPIQDQQVTITASSPGVPVDLYVVLEDDLDKAMGAMRGGAPPENPLASQKKKEQATLEAKIPAKKSFAVVVNNPSQGKKIDVKLKATSK